MVKYLSYDDENLFIEPTLTTKPLQEYNSLHMTRGLAPTFFKIK